MQLKDFDTLAAARLYETTQPRLIHRDTMNSLLASAGLYVSFQALAKDTNNPFQNLIAAFLDSTEYNFMIGNPTGDRQIAALDSIIAAGGDLGAALAQLRPVILSIANPVIKPFENATAHDFAVAKNDINRFKSVPNTAIEQNYLKITTTADCEPHRPSVYTQVHGEYIRVTSFPMVSVAGDYIALVTNHRDLHVDDVYGVVA
jgi:hypothetical protein